VRSAVISNPQWTFLWRIMTDTNGQGKREKKGPSVCAPDPSSHCLRYFLLFTFFARAAEPYRLLKHFRHRRSRRLMKLGARSSLPQ
jgi:hypothetical protein